MSEHASEPADVWRAELSAARAAGDTAKVADLMRRLARLRDPDNALEPRHDMQEG